MFASKVMVMEEKEELENEKSGLLSVSKHRSSDSLIDMITCQLTSQVKTEDMTFNANSVITANDRQCRPMPTNAAQRLTMPYMLLSARACATSF